MRREAGDDLTGKAFAVTVDFPMARTPALEKAMKVCPGDGEEFSPFRFDGVGIKFLLLACQGMAERPEVSVEEFRFLLFTGGFVEQAADEVGDIFHPATLTNILKIEGRDL